MKRIINQMLFKFGYQISKVRSKSAFPSDIESNTAFMQKYQTCSRFTMTSVYRMYALFQATEYISRQKIGGDIVECGVWKGGSAMMIAQTLASMSDVRRQILLYDTYEGMPEPTDLDIDRLGRVAKSKWNESRTESYNAWCYAPLDEVKSNLSRTQYPPERLLFVKGKVEDTIPTTVPQQIALLRLDTDWYQSTYHELTHLFPLVIRGGVIIIDDYNHWQGQRKAVDQYFSENNVQIALVRIDKGGVIGVKQ